MTTANSVNMKFDNGKNFNVTVSKSGSPTYASGANGSVQIASGSAFASSPDLTWANNTLNALNATIPGKLTLGNVGNVSITGGDPLQFLQTDGYGHLNWVTPEIQAPGNIGELTWSDGNGNITTTDLLRWTNTGDRQLQAAGNLVPYTDISYDLGSPALRWRDLYLSGNTIYLGDVAITGANGGIDIVDMVTDTIESNSAIIGNVIANSISGTITQPNQTQITEIGTLNSLTVSGNVTLLGANNLSANFLTGELTTAQQPNITQVGILSGLTVAGTAQLEAITTNFINTPTMLVDNLVMPPFSDTNMGNSVTANYFIGDGSLLTNLQVGPWISNGSANLSVNSTQITAVISGNTPLTVTSAGVTHTNTTTGNLVAANAQVTSANISQLLVGEGNIGNLLIRDNLIVEDDVEIIGNTLMPNLQVQLNIQSDGLLMAQTANIITYNNLGIANLGPIGNIRIQGGGEDQYITTDGLGNIFWKYVAGNIESNSIFGGNSRVGIENDGNVTVTVNGGANVALFTNNTTILQSLSVTGVTNLGNVGNLRISGGNVGDVLTSNGASGVNWTPISPSGRIAVEEVIATAGQVNFTASNTPVGNVMLWINGVSISPTAVSVVATTITYNPGNNSNYIISDGDQVAYSYVWNSSGQFITEEVIATTAQTVFSLTANPRGGLIMSLNGILVRPSAIVIIGSTVTYNPANNDGYVLMAGDGVSFSYIES